MNINEIKIEEIQEKNIVKLFIEAYKLASTITTNLEKEKLIKILSYLISISKLLNYTEKELKKYCFIKMNKTLKIITEKN